MENISWIFLLLQPQTTLFCREHPLGTQALLFFLQLLIPTTTSEVTFLDFG